MTEVVGVLAGMMVVALPFVLSPGASFSLVLAHTMTGSRNAAGKVILGTGAGLFALAAVVGLSGIGAILQAHPLARALVTVAGAIVLSVLGARMIVAGLRGRQGSSTGTAEPGNLAMWSFVVVITNAKALTLYLVVVPTVASGELAGAQPYLAFAAVHTVLQALWLGGVAAMATRLPEAARSPRGQNTVLVLTGSALVGIAVWAAINGLR